MKSILTFLGIIAAAFLVLAVGSGLLLLTAYGVGWAISRMTGWETFQATILGLAGIFVFIFLIERFINTFLPASTLGKYSSFGDDFDDDEFDPDFDDEFDDDDELYVEDIIDNQEELDRIYSAIPRWRRPTKNPDFSKAKPDDRCPCGSGRKYKNCHGKMKK